LKSEDVGGLSVIVNWTFPDLAETPDNLWLLGLSHRTLFSVRGRHDPNANATISIARSLLIDILTQQTTFGDQLGAGNITIDGDATSLLQIFANLDTTAAGFAIVEP